MNIISRAEWGARAPRARSTVTWGDRREVVVHYSEGPTTQTVRSIQDFHMGPDRRWSDVGYNFLVDVQGRIYEGRGWLTVGAHAPDHNSSGIGICMIGRDGDATPAAERSIRAIYDEACRRAGRSLAKLGHRDVYETSCPGDQLWNWVHAGMPTDNVDEQEDDMPDYVSVGMSESQDLPPGEWVTINWGKEFSDSAHHHWDKGGPSLIVGPARYNLTANVRVEGLAVGTELQARVVEVAEEGGKVETGPIAEYAASKGATFLHYNVAADTVRKGYRVRFQVAQYGTTPAKVTDGSAKALAWGTA
ncbi:N-acetylmuramoyl-L-alanine amidase [Actinomadura sp. GTD37]|uniref:N-acetylmuramoyl-L-alanine amidase n=1 Tax=Actinomadura sp. GTD37 TaxID=1778030 RepID=UPI0035BEF549